MRIEEAIQRVKDLGFDWRIIVSEDGEYFSVVYHGVDVSVYPIVDGEVDVRVFPRLPEMFERTVRKLCSSPVYYDDDWWVVASCGDFEVSVMFDGVGFGDVVVSGVGGPLREDVVGALVGAALSGVKFVHRMAGSLYVEFVDGNRLKVRVVGGDVGLFGLSGDDVARLRSVYSGIRMLSDLIPVAEVSYNEGLYSLTVFGEVMELPPNLDYVFEWAKKWSGDRVVVLSGSFSGGRPKKFFAVGEKYVCVVHGEENLDTYWRLREVLGDVGGVISGDSIEVVSDSFTFTGDCVSFSDFGVLKKVSGLVPLPEAVKKYL